MSAEKHAAVEYLYRRVNEDQDYMNILIDHKQAEEYLGPNTLLILLDVNRKVITQYPDLVEKAKKYCRN